MESRQEIEQAIKRLIGFDSGVLDGHISGKALLEQLLPYPTVHQVFQQEREQAVLAERERCARIADEMALPSERDYPTAQAIAAAIRSGAMGSGK